MKTKIMTIDEWWLPLGINWSARMIKENLKPRFWKKRHINPDEIAEIKEITLSSTEIDYAQIILSNGERFYTVGPVAAIILLINKN